MGSLKYKTVLIVEDESDTVEMYAQMLQKNGYGVIKASGGVAGLKHLLYENPDLLLLDLMMPDVSGIEILRFLRREPRLQNIPVIIVSAKSSPEDIEKGLEAGATIYMTKPIEYRELIEAVDKVLATSE